MAFLWHSFVGAMTPGCSQPGQGVGDHNCMVRSHPSFHEAVGCHGPRSSSRSSSGHRGVPGDPNVTRRKFPAKPRVVESGSEDEDEEFEDSRENLPPRDPTGLISNHEQVPPPQSTLAGPSSNSGNQLGLVRVTKGGSS